jgi:IS5 family transposase
VTSAFVLAGCSRSGPNEATMAPVPFAKRLEPSLLRTKVDPQKTLWEAILPAEFLRLPPALERVDRLLDDPVFFEPFVPFFHPAIGRPSIPMETYLRMMFLRFRYRLGFETLCAEVTDSLAWRLFCRIGITDSVPHPTTLMKITTRCGGQAIDQLNEALLRKAMAAHVVKLDRVRTDTTVVPANVSYPTDSGLLAKGLAKLTKTVRALHELGLARRTNFRDRTRSVRRRAHQIAVWLRRRTGDAKDEVLAITDELAKIADAAIKDADIVAKNVRRSLSRSGDSASKKATALVAELERTIRVLEQIVSQTRTRLAGDVPDGSIRVVSLHDTDARPIAKGRLGRPVEFGFKAQVTDNSDGIVVDHQVEMGNPHDAPMLVPAIKRIAKLFDKVPKTATADRGYGEEKVETELFTMGVAHVAIPRKGRPGVQRQKIESAPRFRKLVKWRTGSEGRIAHLKRSAGWNRTLLDGIGGARTWCGWGVLEHNATKIAALIDERRAKDASTGQTPNLRPKATGPPQNHPPPPKNRAA